MHSPTHTRPLHHPAPPSPHLQRDQPHDIGFPHPSRTKKDLLVKLIEGLVANGMQHDGDEGIFKTKPGKTIKVFVVDPAWNETARELVAKYN